MQGEHRASSILDNDEQLKVLDDNNCQEGFMIEMIMRCRIYQILVGHSPFLTIVIIMRSKR